MDELSGLTLSAEQVEAVREVLRVFINHGHEVHDHVYDLIEAVDLPQDDRLDYQVRPSTPPPVSE
jgi:hypothetical protein